MGKLPMRASELSATPSSPSALAGRGGLDIIRRLEVATLAVARAIAGERRDLTARFNPVIGLVQVFQRFRVVPAAGNREREIAAQEARRLGWRGGDYLLVELLHGERDRERLASHEARYGRLLGLGPGWRSFGAIAAGIARQLLIDQSTP